MKRVQIPNDEISFHPSSFADPNGRLFRWNGELYRGLSSEREDFYRYLFEQGIVQTLVDKGLLIETKLTDFAVHDYLMVVKHSMLPFVSYPYEWCPEMLKDAGLIILDLEIELAQRGLALQDGHPWNVLFNGSRPVYVDFGSIIPGDDRIKEWRAYDNFCHFVIYPLYLMAGGYGRIARSLLQDVARGITRSEIEALVPGLMSDRQNGKRSSSNTLQILKACIPNSLRPMLKKTFASFQTSNDTASPKESRVAFLRQIGHQLEMIQFGQTKTEWSGYYDDSFPSFSSRAGWTPKHQSVHLILSELKPRSVLDIGSNRGWYSQLAANLGSSVVAFDIDEICSGRLYEDAKKQALSINPLVMDFRYPSPGCGLYNKECSPATERLKCEGVLALALVHHLVFKQELSFEVIVEGLSMFAANWLLVEFIPREDRYVSEWWSDKYSWYTLDSFITFLKQQFQSIRIYPSDPKPRVLILCEKSGGGAVSKI